jgi:predicted permease
MLQDLRCAFRQLAKSPGFTTVAVLSLALGIGANTALFSVMDAMLLRALPVKNPNELVEFVRLTPDGGKMTNLPYQAFERLQEGRDVLSGLFAFSSRPAAFRTADGLEHATAHEVSGSFFATLGVNALLGRPIGPDDDRPGTANQVVVLSHPFWSRYYGRDPAVLGATVRIEGASLTVIGVMPPDFFGVDRSETPDFWLPLSSNPKPDFVWILGRLKPGIAFSRAHAALEPLFQQAFEPPGDNRAPTQRLELNRATAGTSGLRWSYWEYSYTLRILLGLTGLVLLMACANLATLLLTRSAVRSREIGIRLAVGASRWQIVRQLMVENLLLALLGGALGLLAAIWGHQFLLTLVGYNLPAGPLDCHLDGRLLGFALAISTAAGLLFGLVPAVRAARGDPLSAITGAPQPGRTTRQSFAKALLTLQVALSLILLIGAGLFVRSLRNLATSDLGFPRENLILMRIDPPPTEPARGQSPYWAGLTEQIASLPGVKSASLAGNAVFGGGGWNKDVWVQRTQEAPTKAKAPFNLVGPGFFATTGIPLLLGREFGAQDRDTSPPVAVVNQAFARKFFGDANPIGQRLGDRGPGSEGRCEIVGVVGDAKNAGLRESPQPMVFQPLSQTRWTRSVFLHARTAGESAATIAAIRRALQSLDRDLSVNSGGTLTEVTRDQMRTDQMFATLGSLFGLLALSLSSIGLYGLLAYNVACRTSEIGIRMALGAQRVDIARPILREALLLAAAGLAVGVPAALVLAQLIKTQLYGVAPSDPLSLIIGAVLLLAVALFAAWLPARRAARVDPLVALRSE